MKKLFAIATSVAALIAVGTYAHAAILNAPYQPEVDQRFNAIEAGLANVGAAGYGGNYPGIASGAGVNGTYGDYIAKQVVPLTGVVVGTIALPSLVVPAGAIITQAYIKVNTAMTPSGTTLALKCINANDVFTATDETGASANAIVSGVETGTAATMLYTSAGCTINLTTAVHNFTAGAIEVFVNYILS